MSRKTLRVISIGFFACALPLAFQNCSNVGFTPEPDSEAFLSTLPLQSKQISLDAIPVHTPPSLQVSVLLDDSKSNLDNVESMLVGIDNLVTSIQEEDFSLNVYTIGSLHPARSGYGSNYVDGNPGTHTYSSGTPLATLAKNNLSTSERLAFSNLIKSYLNERRVHYASTVSGDTDPIYKCAMLDILARSSLVDSRARHLVVVVTDEDNDEGTGCYKQRITKFGPQVSAWTVTVPVERLQMLESGGSRWVSDHLTLSPKRCSELNESSFHGYLYTRNEMTGAYQASATRRPKNGVLADTIAGCSEAERLHHPVIGYEYEDYFGANMQSVPLFVDQMQRIFRQSGQHRFFFAGFLTTDASQVRNSDQEVAVEIMKDMSALFAPTNVGFYPIGDRNAYSRFVQDAVTFKDNSKGRSFDLSKVADPTIQKVWIRGVRVRLDGQWVSVKYSASALEVLIIDARVSELKTALEIEVDFSVSPLN